jgi:DNA-binding response OmpR family regulator
MSKPANTTARTRILVVEDDANIRFGLVELLTSEGFAVEACPRGDQALAAVQQYRPALIVLDIMLPGLSGYDICKQLRAQQYKGLVLMLTAKGQEMDKVIGLEMGADDYVTKPFGLRELTARVHALLRRHPTNEISDHDPLSFGECILDSRTFELRRHEKSVALSARELQLFHIFIQHPNEVLSRDRLLSAVWGQEYYGTTRTLDQTIVQLRKKLAEVGADPRQIATVHGFGYRWNHGETGSKDAQTRTKT